MPVKSKSGETNKTTKTVKTVKAVRKTGIEVPLYTSTGDKKGTVFLPKEIFGQEPNNALVAQAVRVYLSNQRSARAKTKGRGEVNKTKRKVYRQKGTGNARHGAKSAPLYVGGGIAHGPRGDRNYKLSLSKALRRRALICALSIKARSGTVLVAELGDIEPKTRVLAKFLAKVGAKGPVALVHDDRTNIVRAGRNIEGVVLSSAKQLNLYQVLASGSLILTEGAVEAMTPKVEK